MKKRTLDIPVVCIALFAGILASNRLGVAQGQPKGRSLPIFEVDHAWPKVPAKWKLGDASSIAIDAQDNIWVLHRPRTLKAEQAAAPPVIVFDGAGNYVKAWGGDGDGYEWPQREHGIYIDNKGFVWLGGNNCPTNGLPRVKPVADDQLLKFTQEGKFVMQIGHSNQSKGNADAQNLHRPADEWVYPPTNELFVGDGYGNHRVAVFDADTGKFKRMWAHSATSQWTMTTARLLRQPASPIPDLSSSASYTPSASRRTAPCMSLIENTGASRCLPRMANF